jgi:prepilin peptidase CpaA
VGAWIGQSQLLTGLVIMALAGGVMAICWAIGGGFLGSLLSSAGRLVVGVARGTRPDPTLTLHHPAAHKMPYAPAIAVGMILSFFSVAG